MATNYTSLLGFALPVTGELSGTWGTTVNDSITQLEEDAIAGVATASVAGGDWTLSTTGTGATNEARKAILIPTGAPGVSRNIVAPSQSKAYIIDNQSDAAVVLKGAATSGVTIAVGENALCAWSDTDFIKIGNFGGNGSFTTLTTSSTVTHNGGTADGVAYLNGSKVLTTGTALTFDGTSLGVSGPIKLTATTTAPSTNNEFAAYSTNGYTYLSGGATGLILANNSGSDTRIRLEDADNIQFEVSSTEQMRLDSTGLGIGTSNPTSALTVGAGGTVRFNRADNNTYNEIKYVSAGDLFYFNQANGGAYQFNINGSEQMRLDSTGLVVGATSTSAKLETYTTGLQTALIATSTYTAGTSAAVITAGSNNGAYGGGYALQLIDKTANGGGAQTGYGLYISAPYDGANASGNTYALTKYGLYIDDIYSYYGINNSGANANWGIYVKGGANNYIAGNLGIGTSSPDVALDVVGEAIIGNGTYGVKLSYSVGDTAGIIDTGNSANKLSFRIGNSEKAKLDSSGNLGLGVTPSAWSAGKAIQVNDVAVSLWGVSGNTVLGNNSYYNSTDKYATTSGASQYAQFNGKHIWYTAPSGTADNAITFTQAMTLHASGGMSLGNTTDPGATNLSVTGTIRGGKGADAASASTVTLGAGNFFDITGTTTISNIDIKSAGTVVYLKFNGSLTIQTGTIGNSGAIRLAGGTSLGVTQYDVLTLVSDGTNWWQVSFTQN